ncbi:unnamed protein product, partial [Mesorhabditis belari]|uniref:Protein-tyrosine phosphatase n=1 Tax=Mesorhabditis belari TaxID=2138241 RepID=A0AAF3EMA3_9BILA
MKRRKTSKQEEKTPEQPKNTALPKSPTAKKKPSGGTETWQKAENRHFHSTDRNDLLNDDALLKQQQEAESSGDDQPKVKGRGSEIAQDNRSKWALNLLANPDAYRSIGREFLKNKTYQAANPDATYFCANMNKNRYGDTRCLDVTRVILKGRSPEDDYINANWIHLDDGFRYICTQGPMEETSEDFWHMIFTEKALVIVMICNFIESNEEKCYRYINPSKKLTFGPFKVTHREKKTIEGIGEEISLNCFEIAKEGEKEPHTIHHFQCTQWNDHTAPTDPRPYAILLKKVRELGGKDGPVVVHCSAGIGRSGSFIMMDLALQKIAKDPKTSLISVLKETRNQRASAVQGILQYLFIHIVVLDTLVLSGTISKDGLYQKLLSKYRGGLKAMEAKQAKKKEEKDRDEKGEQRGK